MVPMIAISPGPALMATALLELGEVLLALKAVVEGLLLIAGDGRTVGTDEVLFEVLLCHSTSTGCVLW